MPGSEVLRVVEEIRGLVVGRYWAAARAAGPMPRVAPDRALFNLRSALERALRTPFIRAGSPLENLLPSALDLVYTSLAYRDVVALSQTSRRLRAQALTFLDSLNAGSSRIPRVPLYLFPFGWAHYEEGPRTISVILPSPESLDSNDVIDVLSGAMSQVQSLAIQVDSWSPTIGRGLSCAMSEPAPCLESFSLVVFLGNTPDSRPPGALDDWDDLFANIAPSLTRCSLYGVGLLPISCAAFRAVTCFDYSIVSTMTTSGILRILTLMPCLRTLALMAGEFHVDAGDTASAEGIMHNTLRNVLLSVLGDRCALPWIPQFQFVTNVALVGAATLALETLPYHSPHGACLGPMDALVFTRYVVSNTETPIRLHHTTGLTELPSSLMLRVAANSLTWLAIDEFVWPDSEAVVPTMNTLRTLTVTLASCSVMTPFYPHAGVFVTACTTTARWAMPRLRELRISSAPRSQESPHLSYDWQACRCDGLTVSLVDIASFIQQGISFTTPKLETIVVAGVTVVDYDFASAWLELMRLSERIDIEEEHDTTYAKRIPGDPGLTGADLDKYFAM